ncbi:MAG TPA: amidohydrolase family protein [Candidatus Limnocylindrales bacterium]|nr:amidohydrolase family protein [Candidatus Limnocylindrales bacterium]
METPEERPNLTRRSFLTWSAVAAAGAAVAACDPVPTLAPSLSAAPPTATPSVSATPGAVETAMPSPSPSSSSRRSSPAPPAGRVLYRDAALADGRSDQLQVGVSVLVDNGTIAWIRPRDDEGDAGNRTGLELVDASGATIVPGMVDCHSHVTLPGGAHWIDRIDDSPTVLAEVAERNGALLTNAGVRWARDVGAPYVEDPVDGQRRALSLGVRDRWAARPEFPHIRAAGTWLDKRGTLPPAAHTVVADTADELLANAIGQLDDGADFLKLYLDGPDPDKSPWTAAEIRRVVDAAHAREAKVTAHSGRLSGARAGVAGGVDAIEHGFELDADVAAEMARRGTVLVSTLAVMRSWLTFGRTTSLPRFATADGRRAIEARLERAVDSVQLAWRAGVAIAAGTDFGGGSLRANQLAWEVESLVAAGLEPWEALGAATWRGGELLGEPAAGVIAEGGPADFFLVHGDPLSEPAALWRVWRVAWSG